MEKVKLQINNLIENRKHLWTTFLLLAAGDIGLLLKISDITTFLLLVIGIFVTIMVFLVIKNVNLDINTLIDKIKE